MRRPRVPGRLNGLWALTVLLLVGLPLGARAEVVRVAAALDGDTLLLGDGRKVRYVGINAPERGQPFHTQALALNRALTAGRAARLEFDLERQDRYGRLLAYVHVGEEMVNARLLREGLAHVYLFPPNLRHAEAFLRLQAEARAKGVGIWTAVRGPLKIVTLRLGLDGEEYVRVANVASGPVDVAGYRISDRAGRTYIFPSLVLLPGRALTLVSGVGPDRLDPDGPIRLHWGADRPIWDNAGDTAFLRAPDGELIDRFDALPPPGGR